MIFAHTIHKVICGEKSQTRRLRKADEEFDTELVRVRSKSTRTVYQIGRTYAIQPNRGKKAMGRIILRGIRHETVASISEDDVKAEGFKSREEFVAAWRKIHGENASLQDEVWVLEFELFCIDGVGVQ